MVEFHHDLGDDEGIFRLLVESAPDGVAVIQRGRFSYVNPAAVRLLGRETADQVVGKELGELLEPAGARLAHHRIGKLLDSGQRFRQPSEYKSRRPDGETIDVEISSIPIEYHGQPAVLGFARDITERKAMQNRLLQADRLSAVGTLSAGLAHEINNPLSYLLLNLQYVQQQFDVGFEGSDMEAVVARLADALHGAERVASIVRDLRAFARGDDGEQRPVKLARVVEAALRVAQNTVRHRGTLVTDLASVPPVVCNPQRMEQVVLNLLVNAAQALPSDNLEQNRIEVSLRQEGDQVVLRVSDNGVGLPEDQMEKVFEPFFTTKPVGVGTGLGLPICRSIVESSGGQLTARSEPGRGTTFEARLPAASEPVKDAEDAVGELARTPNPRGKRIMVIDDEPALRVTLEMLLRGDFDVSVAASAADALHLLRHDPSADLILCDVMMPLKSGIDLYLDIEREFPELKSRVVFMTGGAIGNEAAKFLERTQNQKLEKPFDVNAVLELISTLDG